MAGSQYAILTGGGRSFYESHIREPFVIDIPEQEIALRFFPEKPLQGDFELFAYLYQHDESLKSSRMGVRQCISCYPQDNLYIVSYDETLKKAKVNVRFLKKIGRRDNDNFPRYLFNHGEGFGSFDAAFCPECIERYKKKRAEYTITTA